MNQISIKNHGSIFLVRAYTDEARTWLEEHTDGQWFGGALAVEHRYIEDLAQGMADAGLITPEPVQA